MRLASPLALLVIHAAAILANSSTNSEYAQLSSAQLLSRADMLLSSGHGLNAVELYDELVSRDSASFLNLYKRATAYLSIGQTRRALDDFLSVLALHEFDPARLASIRIQVKQGDYTSAEPSLAIYTSRNKGDSVASDLKKDVKKAKKARQDAQKAREKKDWKTCTQRAEEGLDISLHSVDLLESRAACFTQMGKIEEAIADLSRAVSLEPNSPPLLMRLTLLNSVFLSPSSSSLGPVKQCLHFDPDSKPCKRLFRSLKSIEKDYSKARNFIEAKSWRSAIGILDPKNAQETGDGLVNRVKEVIDEYGTMVPSGENTSSGGGGRQEKLDDTHSSFLTQLYGWTCRSHSSSSSIRLSKPFCEATHSRDANNLDGLYGLGELALKETNYSEAVSYFSSAFESSGRSDRSLLEKLQKAQRLLKQSKSKDYYKVLGVSRDADQATIKRAYKKAAVRAHPDKPTGSEDKMAAVNEAWEVLGNPELKARFDNGDDPNDPESAQQAHHQHQYHSGFGHGHPFQQQQQQGGFGGAGGGGQQQFFQQFFQQGGAGHGHGQQFKFNFG